MTLYVAQFGIERIIAAQRALRTDVDRLKTRTAGIDSGFPLMALPGVIDPGYTSGDPMAYVNGAAALTGPYQHLASYTPAASDPVLLIPVPALQSYVIAGKLA
jgi:hypothetical protein